MSEEMSDQEVIERLADAMKDSSMSPEEKQNIFTFLTKVATTHDTTKTGYLRDDKDLNEVGIPKLPVRTFHSLALIAEEIMNNKFFSDYFKKEAEIVSKTSLARDGFLTKLAVIQKREVADVTPQRGKGENKGWFKKRQQPQGQPQGYTP